jgi:hypothetical protein
MRSEALKPPVSFSSGPVGGPPLPPDRGGPPPYGSDMRGHPGYPDMSSAAAYGSMGAAGMSGMGAGYGGYGDFAGYSSMGIGA